MLDLLFPFVVIAVAGLTVLVTVGVSSFILWRLLGTRRFVLQSLVWLWIILGSVPLSVLAVLFYARNADYVWAIRGPYPFSHLGGGPFMLWMFFGTLLVTSFCWGMALWLSVLVNKWQQERGA